MKKTVLQLGADLTSAIDNLQGNVNSYDIGFVSVTLSISASIRALFHQTNKSECLVKQICDMQNKKFDRLEMISRKRQYPSEARYVFFDGSMCEMNYDANGLQFIPNYNSAPQRHIPFGEWWDEFVIRDVRNGFENPIWHSRRELILAHANREGGAHYDSSVSKLHDLGSSAASGWAYTDGNNVSKICVRNQKSATIRQIGFEVLESLYLHFPEHFDRLIF